MWKTFLKYGRHATPISKPLNQLAVATRRPPEVEETEPFKNAEDTEKSVNAMRAPEILI